MIIRPTSRGWLVMISAITAFLIALVNASLGVSILAAGCVALAVSSFVMTFFSLHRVSVEREPMSDGQMGQPIPLPVRVKNESRFHRQSLLLTEDVPFAPDGHVTEVILPMAPEESRHVRRAILPRRRGEYLMQKLILRGGDPAGLFYRQVEFDYPQEIMIYPRIVNVGDMHLTLRDRVIASSIGQPIGISGQGQDFYGVREYRPTDGMRFIHWKVSARQNKLMVREFEENSVNQISVFLDVNQDYVNPQDHANFEYQVSVAASISAHLAGMYFQNLVSVGPRDAGYQLNGPAHAIHADVMRMLANIQPMKCSIVDQLGQCLERIAPNSILYCLTLHEPKGLEDTFAMLANKDVDVRWIHAPRSLFAEAPSAVTADAITRFATRRQSAVLPRIGGPGTPIERLLSEA